MGGTYSQHLSNDVGLFMFSGVVIIMLGSLWVGNMRDAFYAWKCRNDDTFLGEHPCPRMETVIQFSAICLVFSLAMYYIVASYSKYLAKNYPIPQ